MSKIRDYLSKIKWSERRILRGFEHSDKTFYVIRRNSKNVGLFSYVLTNLGHIEYAVEHGWIPVIDMQNYDNTYLENKGENAWEYYFKQPMNYGLQDIKRARNIILSSGDLPANYPSQRVLTDTDERKRWGKLYQEYVHINKNTQRYIVEMQENTFGQNKNVLGVLCRGTDYMQMQPKGHPKQPSIEQVISKIDETMKQYGYEYLYLATEDAVIFEQMKEKYKDKLLFPPIKLREYNPQLYITQISADRYRDREKKGREYLAQIALLSQCDGIIAAGCGGTYGAALMNLNYKTQYFWDLSVY